MVRASCIIPWYEEGSDVPVKSSPPFNLGSPAIQVPKVPPLRIPILHLIPWNSPNGGMDEGYIWVWPTESKMQVEGKISSNKKD